MCNGAAMWIAGFLCGGTRAMKTPLCLLVIVAAAVVRVWLPRPLVAIRGNARHGSTVRPGQHPDQWSGGRSNAASASSSFIMNGALSFVVVEFSGKRPTLSPQAPI
jgi:hypothetical protein